MKIRVSLTSLHYFLMVKSDDGIRCIFGDYLSHVTRKPVFQVSDTNQVVQPKQMASGLKFPI